jgi:hypothetical protein
MAHKQVFFRSEARERILRGVTALADAVRVTLGPKSRCVLIEKAFGLPLSAMTGDHRQGDGAHDRSKPNEMTVRLPNARGCRRRHQH